MIPNADAENEFPIDCDPLPGYEEVGIDCL
jgi:hypothetical protein